MTTLLPTSQSTGVETYEDMFKEITRKLYGDESAHGLYPHNTQVAQVAQLAPGAPTAPPDGGERSFTTLTQIGYETTTVGGANQPTSSTTQQQQQQEQITTAFGLAALMQNGFPPPGTMLNPVNFPGASKTPTNISIPSTDDRWQSQQPVPEEPWNGGKHASPSGYGGGKSYKKPKTEPQDSTASPTGLNIPSTVDRANKSGSYGGSATSPTGSSIIKRYSCTSCPYTTDRRDLFTRHENIHKDEKPFQCYACLKPFNRADHVKKHFLRMHRELEYDIAKTRRHPPGGGPSAAKSAYYTTTSSQPSATVQSGTSSSSSSSSTTAAMSLAQMQLNIPSGSFSTAPSLVVPSHTIESSSSSGHLNGTHTAQLLQLQTHHQQQQLQHHQQHANLHPQSQLASVTIKQEKSSSVPGSLNTSTASSSGSPDEKGGYSKKIKGEKKFACTYCPWAGADNWGLKRHLNTHTKPYVCLMCDYKAARSERLATHVLKVHNKKACSKCNFFAEDQAHLDAHLQEAHSHDASKAAGKGSGGTGSTTGNHSSSSSSVPHPGTVAAGNDANGNVLRNLGNAFTSNNLPTNIPTSGNGFGNGTSNGQYHTANLHQPATGNVLTNSNAANLIETINQHVLASSVGQNGGGGPGSSLQQHQQWIATRTHRKRGPDLLYSYLEADGSDSGDYARLLHMQAVGRNKASVTQDFRNAGGGDNGGDAGDSAAKTTTPYDALSMAAAAFERQMKKKHHNSAQDSKNHGTTSQPDGVNLSLASLFGGDQLSFLQLLATAAVAHQQLQLHSNQQQQQQQPYLQHHHQQQKKQQHPKPSKAVDHHTVGAANGGRYGGSSSSSSSSTMVSSPPATSTQQPLTASTTSATSYSTNGTGSGTFGPFIDPQYQQLQPLALDMGSTKKRRAAPNNESSSDKENNVQRNRINGGVSNGGPIASQQSNGGTAAVVGIATSNGGSAINGGIIDKHNPNHKNGHNLHHHLHHPHHHNNNNSSTSNKNINDIFDKVYKKPQNSFHASKQPTVGTAHTATLATILRTAPPSAVEEDNRRDAQTQAERFSLTEFLKSHTEVSISTVGGKGSEEASPVTIIPLPLVTADRSQDAKENADSERSGRKRYQPRRIGESDDPASSSTDPMSFVSVEMLDVSIETKQEELAKGPVEQVKPEEIDLAIDLKVHSKPPVPAEQEPQQAVSRMADIRDKHMIKLISNRRCCRICRSKGLLDHLDNAHYHSKMSLFLHMLWRHRGCAAEEPVQCRNCDAKFRRRYMLILHQKLTKHTDVEMKVDPIKQAPNCTNGKQSNKQAAAVAGVRNKRKQRKRKTRSHCFTAKRRK